MHGESKGGSVTFTVADLTSQELLDKLMDSVKANPRRLVSFYAERTDLPDDSAAPTRITLQVTSASVMVRDSITTKFVCEDENHNLVVIMISHEMLEDSEARISFEMFITN